MEKHLVDREIYSKVIHDNEITWRHLKELQKLKLKVNDRVYITEEIKYNADYEDERWFELSVHRYTKETDEEYYKRIGEEELEKQAFEARMKEVRRKRYLELKKEFE